MRVLRSLSIDPSELADQLEREPDESRRGPFLTYAAEQALRRAAEEATRLEENAVGSEHLLLALAAEHVGHVARTLDALGVSLDSLRRQIALLLSQAPPPSEQSDA